MERAAQLVRYETPQAAMAFYGEAINRHRFDDLLPVLSEDVSFLFSSGSFAGLDAARQAFEATWGRIADETYRIEDLRWIVSGTDAATCLYLFHWRGRIGGEMREGGGRGTSVLRRDAAGWRIVHEHLSAHPT